MALLANLEDMLSYPSPRCLKALRASVTFAESVEGCLPHANTTPNQSMYLSFIFVGGLKIEAFIGGQFLVRISTSNSEIGLVGKLVKAIVKRKQTIGCRLVLK